MNILILIFILSILFYILVSYICIQKFLVVLKKECLTRRKYLNLLETKSLITIFTLKVATIICVIVNIIMFFIALKNMINLTDINDRYIYLFV